MDKQEIEKARKELNSYPFNYKAIMGENGFNALQTALKVFEEYEKLKVHFEDHKIGDILEVYEQTERYRELLERFIDDESCSFDHHGYCQTHGVTKPCINQEAKEALKTSS